MVSRWIKTFLYVSINEAFPWIFAILCTSALIFFVGDSPINVAKVFWHSSFTSLDGITSTLHYSTPYLFTGTAAWLALRTGLFNIGVEGQLYIGAIAAISVGLYCTDHNASIAVGALFSCTAAVIAGGFWAGISGYLRAKRGVHEVISSILLNFIALGLSSWIVIHVFKNPETQGLETRWIAEKFRFSPILGELTYGFPIALFISAVSVWLINRTYFGYRVRAVGQNAFAAKTAGISPNKNIILGIFISGGVAGILGFQEVFMNSYRLVDSFSSGFGFVGLAVALLARNSAFGICLGALFFGVIRKGSLDLDIETENITRDLANVIQAIVLVGIAMRKKGS